MVETKHKTHKIPWNLILVFFILALSIWAAGYYYYRNQKEAIKKDVHEELSAIAELKVNQISTWRKERLGDAKLIMESPFISEHAEQFFSNLRAVKPGQEILDWMKTLQEHFQYQHIFLIDAEGEMRLSVPKEGEVLGKYAKMLALEATKQRKIILSDLHRGESGKDIHLDLLVPLFLQRGKNIHAVGAVLLRIDPEQFLYPLIQSWPTSSKSAETLLVRREGNEVIFLNELRHKKNTALSLRFPLDRKQLPAVMAVSGKQGIVEGIDYRGIPVLAALHAIPDSPWFLVSKVDKEEVYARIKKRAWFIGIIISLLIVAAGLSIGFIWRQQRLKFFERQYEIEHERQLYAQRYEYLTRYANDIILLIDGDKRIVNANERAIQTYGYECDKLFSMKLGDLRATETRPLLNEQIKEIEAHNGMVFETLHQRKDGTVFPVEVSSRIVEIDGKKYYQSIIRDISERKQTEEKLRKSENKYRVLIENLPQKIFSKDRNSVYISCNENYARDLKIRPDEITGKTDYDFYPEELAEKYRADDARIMKSGKTEELEEKYIQDGKERFVKTVKTPIKDEKGNIVGILGIFWDITERKRTEEVLEKLRRQNELILNSAGEGILGLDLQGNHTFVNPAAARMLGYEIEELIGRHSHTAWHHSRSDGSTYPEEECPVYAAYRDGAVYTDDAEVFWRKDGTSFPVRYISTPILEDGKIAGAVVTFRDISERKWAEKALRESEERYRTMIETMNEGISVVDENGLIAFVNDQFCKMIGYPQDKLLGYHETILLDEENQRILERQWAARKKGEALSYEIILIRKDGKKIHVLVSPRSIFDENNNFKGSLGIFTEITDRKKAEEQIKQQLSRMTALRNIGMAITASLDLRVTLNVFLEHVISQLHVDAATVLLLNPHTQTLEYGSGRGFRSTALKYTRLRLGEGHAGRAALERHIVSIPNLAEAEDSFSRSPLLASEGFISYYAVPLIAKGNIKGVLEIFHRAMLAPDQEWLDFLEALATQAAIAIDNASLFDDLQRSNVDLILAYDRTLEGWSKALDMRDRETEGHSQRVTAMTVKIANTMGISDTELVHVRRGALLHDIGKMGIPDNILLKPGPLNDEEWKTMHKHPVYAYEMLLPITFLRPALDIPYYHHEKWDGTGYPHGLKGKQIPLSARIFALVDVWDALNSDRPYRPAWPEEKVREYIRDQAGKHFDPEVVEVFFKINGQSPDEV